MRILTLVAIAATAAILAAASASAHRPPLGREQQALVGAVVRQDLAASAAPVSCLDLRFLVSTVDERYAAATNYFRPTQACRRWRFNGYLVLFYDLGGWRVVFRGSDPPPCARVPDAVARDLTGLRCLRA